MRVLADSTFPSSVVGAHSHGHLVDRYDMATSDRRLVAHASKHDYDVVVLVGRAGLASPTLRQEALERNLPIAVTTEEDPDIAARHLLSKLDRLEMLVADHQFILVRASDLVTSP